LAIDSSTPNLKTGPFWSGAFEMLVMMQEEAKNNTAQIK
jgi:hypothetical protein